MENLKNKKELGLGIIIFSIIVGVFSYDYGKTSGYNGTKSTFLDSAYISSCDDGGEYCYIDTKDGEKTIPCDEKSKCLMIRKIPKTPEEIKQDAILDKIFNESVPTKEEIQKILNDQ